MNNKSVVRQLRKPNLWIVFILLALLLWGVVFYWIAQPTRAEKLEIWLSADFQLKNEISDKIEENVKPFGIKKVVIGNYNPNDAYFAQAFSLKAHSVDVYIMTKDMAETIQQTKLFKALNYPLEGATYLTIDNLNYGVLFVGDYYIFVNATSKKSDELLQTVIQTLMDGANK